MTSVPKDEQAVILQLALMEASRKEDECLFDIRNMEELRSRNADAPNLDAIDESIQYLTRCKEGWQTTIRHIKNWQREVAE